MDLSLKVWRQASANEEGEFKTYQAKNVSPEASFLEMLDEVNEELNTAGEDPIAFEHDCREGICGACGVMINGSPHGPQSGTATCQLHMRKFNDDDSITIEPWRATAFPVLKDLIVDRESLDRIHQAGGYVSVATGGTPDANAIPVAKVEADVAFDGAACIGCGACVAACKNASAMLFVAAKVGHLAHLPQGQTEGRERAQAMVLAMDAEAFGACTNTYDCEGACPKEISVDFISELNRTFRKGLLAGR